MPSLTDRGFNSSDPLAFSERKQDALLGHCISDRLFFLQVYNHLAPGWFFQTNNQRLYSSLQKFYAKNARYPQSPDELVASSVVMGEDQKVRSGIITAYHECLAASGDFGKDILVGEFGLWARSMVLEDHIQQTATLYNSKRPEEALATYKEGYRLIQAAELIGGGQAEEWDLEAFVKGQKNDLENGITFGCPQLDYKLNPSAPNGALLRGDTTVILAPSNIGKTTALVTVAAHNILAGKDVLFLTHEGRPEDIKFKVLCCILQVTREEFLKLYATDKWFRTRANLVSNTIKAHLTYIAFNKPFANIKEVEALVRREQELRKNTKGKGYDLLIDDYPALLYTEGLLSGQMQKRISDEQVYGCFVSMALDYGFHCLLAVQTNREGSKVNRGQGVSTRLLTMEDVMESWGVMTKATNVLTMNRSPADMIKQRVTFYLCKSRSSDTGWAFTCQSNYSKSTTHAPAGWPEVAGEEFWIDGKPRGEMFLEKNKSSRPGVNFFKYGCTAYQGADATTDRLDALIHAHRGSTIPEVDFQFAITGKVSKGMTGSAPTLQAA